MSGIQFLCSQADQLIATARESANAIKEDIRLGIESNGLTNEVQIFRQVGRILHHVIVVVLTSHRRLVKFSDIFQAIHTE